MSVALLMVAFVCGYYFCGASSRPLIKAMRAESRRHVKMLRARKDPPEKKTEIRYVCDNCLKTQDAPPFKIPKITIEEFRTMMEESRDGNFEEVSGTGCELTDKIFAAAWKKGIRPIDVIGPEPGFKG